MIKVVLQEQLDARNLTVDDVARETGLDRRMLSRLASGRTSIGLHTLDVLCEFLKIEPGELFRRTPGEQPAGE